MLTRREAIKRLSLSAAAVAVAPWAPAQTGISQFPEPPAPADPHSLPPLPYPPEALEPHIDTQTMILHYSKHHGGYVNNLNKALAGYPHLARLSIEELIADIDALPADIRTTVRNNGGGHLNHTIFWNTLSPEGGGEPAGMLREAIDRELGGFESFRDALTRAALSVFGSGWAWLSLDTDGRLNVETTPNQDTPLMFGRQPLFGIDVWEHAYYLKYQNRRAEYVQAIWNIVYWPAVAARYERFKKS